MAGDDAPSSPGRPWWTVALGVGVVLVVIGAVSGALGRPDLPGGRDPDQGVELPDRSEVEALDACPVGSCERWRVELGGGRLRMTDRLAVHEREGVLTAVDLDDGAITWRTELADGSPMQLYADDAVVVASYQATGEWGARLAAFETATGDPIFDRTYDGWSTVDQVQHIADMLVVDLTVVDDGLTGGRAVVDLAGVVTARRDEVGLLIRWRNVLLEATSGEVSGITDRGDRITTWSTEGEWTDIDLTGGRVLVRAPSGDIAVHDIASGSLLWSTPPDDIVQAQFIGTWVGLTSDDGGMRILDPDDGTTRFRRSGVAPTARVAHLALERYTVVAWPVADGIELGVYDEDGVEVVTRDIPDADAASAWVTLAPVAGEPDMVQVVADNGRRSTWIALPSGEVPRAAVDEDPRPWDRDFGDGLLWRSRADELVMEGPAGSLTVEGATEVASVEPLVVHGPDGLARLEPGPVFGGPTGD